MKQTLSAGGIGLACLLVAGPGAQAAGFYLQDQSILGGGRAFSGEAADMGAQSMWWNPASIAGIQQSQSYGGVVGILPDSDVRNRSSTLTNPFAGTFPVGGNDHISNPVQNGVLPSGAFAWRFSDQWSVGIDSTSPFSFITKYPTDSWTRYAAETSRLTTIDLQPTVAWRPVRWLGIGIGPNVEYTLADFSNALPNLVPGSPDGQQTLHVNGWDVGYNVGVQLHLTDRLTFGAAYRSRIQHNLSGKLDIAGLGGPLAAEDLRADAGAKFTTPWAATFGVRWQATDRLALNAQAVRTGWSVFDAVVVTSPIATTTNENYQDTLNGAFGADFAVTPRWTVRGGVQYDPTPTQGDGRDPRVPDGNRWTFALGTSVKATSNLTIDASLNYIDFQNARISRNATAYGGTPVETPIDLEGNVEASAWVVGLGTRMFF